MKQRFCTVLAVLSLLLALSAPALAVDEDTRLETIRVLGIMTGDENGDLALDRQITRAEFVKMMAAASVYKDTVGEGGSASLFTDVKTGHWAVGYIKLAVEQGWVTGYVDGSFRPDNTITLEEACTALLRLLGYDSGSLAGSFPDAQLSKARAVGLLDDMSLSQGDILTRRECVTLFYNLLTAETSDGTVYGTTLGYTVTNGEVDYAALVSANTEGPYIAGSGGSLELPFSTSNLTAYRNGTLSSLSAAEQYDVYYYSQALRTVWIYHDRVTGTLTEVSPSTTAPTAVTVAGNSYELGASSASYKFSSQGSFSEGDVVTLLLGMDGTVADVLSAEEIEAVYYGVVLSSEKGAADSSTSTSGSTSVQTTTQVICTDGVSRTFYTDGAAYSAGRVVSVTVSGSGTSIKTLSNKSLSGSVNRAGTRLAGYDFAEEAQILDFDDNGGYASLDADRLSGVSLDSGDVRYYTLDENGDIDHLILHEVTGDTLTYAYITRAESSVNDMNVSGSYTYLLDGQSYSISGSVAYNVSVGGAVLLYEDGELSSIQQLEDVTLTQLSTLYAMAGNQKYLLADDVQVLLRDTSLSGGLYATTLDQINDEDYTLKGWYDDQGFPAGGRIRIIVATPK